MAWIIVGIGSGIVTVSAFAGTAIANWWNSGSESNEEQDTKIASLQSQMNGVNINVKNDSVNNVGSTMIGLIIVLCVIQLILLIAVLSWIVKKCCCVNTPASRNHQSSRRNSFELRTIHTSS